jgi:hypothetical protein
MTRRCGGAIEELRCARSTHKTYGAQLDLCPVRIASYVRPGPPKAAYASNLGPIALASDTGGGLLPWRSEVRLFEAAAGVTKLLLFGSDVHGPGLKNL